MKILRRPQFSNVWLFGAVLAWSVLFLACTSVTRTVVAPTTIAGATYVGSAECATCHSETVDGFKHATHANLSIAGAQGVDPSCESCHGAGSKHVQAGGGRGVFIVNPGKEPETCFQCHLDKRGEFNLPHAHPVIAGKVSCTDCHNPHKGRAIDNSAAALGSENQTCTKCHTAQAGPYVFKHNAMVEGCTSCHNPHGSVNQKMLVARDANLCLRCHLEHPATLKNTATGQPGFVGDGKIVVGGEDHRTRLQNGTCWVSGCHEAVHGSNSSKPLRY